MKQYSLEKFKKFRKARKNLKVAIIIIIVSVIIVLLALYLANNEFRKFVDINILRKEINEDNAVQLKLDVEKLSFISVFNNKFLTVNGGVLTFYSERGKEEEKIDVILSNPISDSSNKYLILGDNGGNKLYLIKDKSIKWEKTVDGKISNVSVNKSGYVSVIVTDTRYESIIIVYDKNGNRLFNRYLSSSYAVDSDISKNSKYLAIAEVDYSGTSAQSKIKIISIEAAHNEKDKDNAIVYTYTGNAGEIVTKINYQEKDAVNCMFDSYIVRVKPNEHQIIYNNSENTLFTDINLNNEYVKIERESSQIFKSEYRMRICNSNNSKEHLYALNENVKRLKADDDIIAILSRTNIEFISKRGWLKKRYIISRDVKDIVISKNLVAIIYKDRIDLISL